MHASPANHLLMAFQKPMVIISDYTVIENKEKGVFY